jgi:uncharacterized RDD family membrane protein YckC
MNNYATFWQRFAAMWIDFFLLLPLTGHSWRWLPLPILTTTALAGYSAPRIWPPISRLGSLGPQQGQIWVWSEVVVMLFNKRRRALHDFIAGTIVTSELRIRDA